MPRHNVIRIVTPAFYVREDGTFDPLEDIIYSSVRVGDDATLQEADAEIAALEAMGMVHATA